MRKKILLLSLFIITTLLFAQAKEEKNTIFIRNVTIIDGSGTPAKPDMTLVIEENHIASIANSNNISIPKDARVIDGRGKFLIPGLWDMHIHLTLVPDKSVSRELIAPLLVAYGVTGVRDMGGDWQRILELRKDIANGELLGPRIISPGPFIDALQEPSVSLLSVSNEEEAREAVRKLKSQGVDFIKVQADLSLPLWKTILSEAEKLGIPVAGHIPERISAFDVARSTQKSIEHISPALPGDAGILMACSAKESELRQEMLEIEHLAQEPNADRQALRQRQRVLQKMMITTYDKEKCDSLLAMLVKNQIAAVPTQIFGKRFAPLNESDLPTDDALRFAPHSMRTRWDNRRGEVIKNSKPEDFALRMMIFEKSKDLVGAMHSSGVKLMAGTDAIDGYILPGFSLHQELALMVEAGLSPMEALQTATSYPAKFLKMENSVGTIEKGKIADLVLLDANPLDNINNTQKIAAVIVNGRYLPKSELDKILAGIETAAIKK